jgi:transposase-like protein
MPTLPPYRAPVPPATPEQRAEARRLYEEEGQSFRQVAKAVGYNRSTIMSWSRTEDWHQPGSPRIPSDADIDDARRRHEDASLRARTTWAVRREQEGDAAGVMAALARQKIREQLEAKTPNHQVMRASISAYQTFVEAAQLLSGGATSRTEAPGVAAPLAATPGEVADDVRARAFRLLHGDASDAK